jgi:hypothetical protein
MEWPNVPPLEISLANSEHLGEYCVGQLIDTGASGIYFIPYEACLIKNLYNATLFRYRRKWNAAPLEVLKVTIITTVG